MPVRQRTALDVPPDRLSAIAPAASRATAAHLAAIRVESNDVPGANIVTVITFGLVARCSAKVTVVTAGAGGSDIRDCPRQGE